MAEHDQLLEIVRARGLDQIQPASKDALAVHAENFAGNLERYLDASRKAWAEAIEHGGVVDMSKIEPALGRYETSAAFYAPGLVGALARLATRQDAALGRINQSARAALAGADSKGAVVWRDALQAIVTEIEELAGA